MVDSLPKEQNFFLVSIEEVNKWPLMGSPWTVLTIVAAYLLFVIKIGPDIMRNREPLNIKGFMFIYNLYQTLTNAHIALQLFIIPGALTYVRTHFCYPMDPAKNYYLFDLNRVTWYFLISKVVDLLDTVFMIFRKKFSHITFLHVYHHASMVLFVWYYLKYVKGEQGVIAGTLNAWVHVIMYSYYLLSLLGPQVQKYLWWKKYITKLQMTQFVIIFVYIMIQITLDCPLPKMFSIYLMIQVSVFFVLFANFYIKTYFLKPRKSNKSSEPSKIK